MTTRVPSRFGSDLIVDLFKALGVEYVALNPGSTFRGIHDSIVNYGGNSHPEVIECNHEEIAVAIAHGYAKASGKPMVAMAHNVVGLLHSSMAIFNAWCDRVPVLVMGGTGPMDTTKRRPWIDWIHTALVQGNVVREFVKWDDQPASIEAIADSILRAWRIAITEPQGPVYICFDVEHQEAELPSSIKLPDMSGYTPPTTLYPDPNKLEEVARWLVGANSPVIIADRMGRKAGAVEALVKLAETLAAPVIDKSGCLNFPSNHPLDLTGADVELLGNADVIL
ncbi:MAG: thiamine pyrophosphate-binding protein, partial [Dehalococcoidia bacterium]|nr:thiamine pyrophosphate-binding protein [Dehalococcoidia bacterium]